MTVDDPNIAPAPNRAALPTQLSYQATEQDLVDERHWQARSQPAGTAVFLLGPPIGLLLLHVWIGSVPVAAAVLLAVGLCFCWLMAIDSIWWQPAKKFRRTNPAQHQRRLELTDDRLVIWWGADSLSFTWRYVSGVQVGPLGLRVRVAEYLHFVPLRAFASAEHLSAVSAAVRQRALREPPISPPQQDPEQERNWPATFLLWLMLMVIFITVARAHAHHR